MAESWTNQSGIRGDGIWTRAASTFLDGVFIVLTPIRVGDALENIAFSTRFHTFALFFNSPQLGWQHEDPYGGRYFPRGLQLRRDSVYPEVFRLCMEARISHSRVQPARPRLS